MATDCATVLPWSLPASFGDPYYNEAADIDGSGCVNITDQGILLANWGNSCP
jgi:hypothetical protein